MQLRKVTEQIGPQKQKQEAATYLQLRKVTEQIGPRKQKQEAATYLQLRKVTEQVGPQKQKQEGRDALLDQIRAKVRLNRFDYATQTLQLFMVNAHIHLCWSVLQPETCCNNKA